MATETSAGTRTMAFVNTCCLWFMDLAWTAVAAACMRCSCDCARVAAPPPLSVKLRAQTKKHGARVIGPYCCYGTIQGTVILALPCCC